MRFGPRLVKPGSLLFLLLTLAGAPALSAQETCYDSCPQWVCDTSQTWVDEYCENCNQVCDTGWNWVEDTCQSCNQVCDTGWNWVEDQCESCNEVCDTCTDCWEECDEWSCWTNCSSYACNCRTECSSYGCGGHWESYEHNCRNECSDGCNGRWESYQYNCRTECDNQVCGGHWETQETNCRWEEQACNPHPCMPPPPTEWCGDGSCNNGEDCNSCSGDCGGCVPPPPACGCAGQNNPYEDADGDCIPGPPFGDDCNDGDCSIGGGCSPPPPACACAGQNNPYEDADGDCIPGPPFGDDCNDGDCSIGGGCSPPPPACACAGQNNPYEDADGDCIAGPPFGDDCNDGDCSIGGGCSPPPPACACAGQNNPYEDADGDCVSGPPFGDDCNDGDCSIGGGCAVCDNNATCEFNETFSSCPSDCPVQCSCAGQNNPFEDADGDCIPGPPFGDDCNDGDCSIGGGCAVCDHNTICEFGETSASCPSDCPVGFSVSAGGPYEGMPGEPIQFTAAVTTNPGESIVAYEWSFGDGGSAEGPSPSHTYDEEGQFVVSLTARTNTGNSQTATTVASVGVVTAYSAEALMSLFYEQYLDRLSASASIRFLEYWELGLVLMRIYDPAGTKVFDSGLVPIPLIRTINAPRAGMWRMRVTFFVRNRWTGVERQIADAETERSVDHTCPPRCDTSCPGNNWCIRVSPKDGKVDDGRDILYRADLTQPVPIQRYEWLSSLPAGLQFGSTRGQPRPIQFTPSVSSFENTTRARPVWYAHPAIECPTISGVFDSETVRAQRLTNSVYNVQGFAYSQSNGWAWQIERLTVQLPWTAPGFTPYPKVVGEPAFVCDPECRVTGPGSLMRQLPTPRYGLETSSVFYEKVKAHEDNHVQWWATTGLSFFRVDDLVARLTPLRSTSPDAFRAMLNTQTLFWHIDEELRSLPYDNAIEKAAYDVSDSIDPRFVLQNCGRYQ